MCLSCVSSQSLHFTVIQIHNLIPKLVLGWEMTWDSQNEANKYNLSHNRRLRCSNYTLRVEFSILQFLRSTTISCQQCRNTQSLQSAPPVACNGTGCKEQERYSWKVVAKASPSYVAWGQMAKENLSTVTWDCPITITQLSRDHHMTITWLSHNYHMTVTWLSHDHHMTHRLSHKWWRRVGPLLHRTVTCT